MKLLVAVDRDRLGRERVPQGVGGDRVPDRFSELGFGRKAQAQKSRQASCKSHSESHGRLLSMVNAQSLD